MTDIRIITVHGTGDGEPADGDAKWWQPGSVFNRELLDAMRAAGVSATVEAFRWNGKNSTTARRRAAFRLGKQLSEGGAVLIGHSHGGNVARDAFALRAVNASGGLVTVGTPFLRTKPQRIAAVLRPLFALAAVMSAVLFALAMGGYLVEGPDGQAFFDRPVVFNTARALTLVTLVYIGASLASYERSPLTSNKRSVFIKFSIHRYDEALSFLYSIFNFRYRDIDTFTFILKSLLGSLVALIPISFGLIVYSITSNPPISGPLAQWVNEDNRINILGIFDILAASIVAASFFMAIGIVFVLLASGLLEPISKYFLRTLTIGKAFGVDGTTTIAAVGGTPEEPNASEFSFPPDWSEEVAQETAREAARSYGEARARLSQFGSIEWAAEHMLDPSNASLIHTRYFDDPRSRTAIIQAAVDVALAYRSR